MHCWDGSLHIVCPTHQVNSFKAYTPWRAIRPCRAGRFLALQQRLYTSCLVPCTQLPPQRSLLNHQQLSPRGPTAPNECKTKSQLIALTRGPSLHDSALQAVRRIRCTPLSENTGSLSSPTFSAYVASSNGFCIWPGLRV